jgi:Ca2+-binding RTX toxin-like protein
MALAYLHKTELPTALNTANLDPGVQNRIIQQLITDHLYDSSDDTPKIWVESDQLGGHLFGTPGGDGPNVSAKVALLEVEGTNEIVHTDSNLKVIVDDGATSGLNVLDVTGDKNPELIVLGKSNTVVVLQDKGNDTVLGGSGNDIIFANAGDDSIVGGGGNDQLFGGAGHDTLVAGAGNDSLYGGTGANYLYGGEGESTLTAGTGKQSWLEAGSGKTVIIDMASGGTDTLVAGPGSDTITGLQGDHFKTGSGSMAATGNDVYNIYGSSGNSTIDLGSGNDKVNFFTTGGHDTINNGGGSDTVFFANHSSDDLLSYQKLTGANSGDYLLKFTDGETVRLNAHSVHNSSAFVIEFNDGTGLPPLKGGA